MTIKALVATPQSDAALRKKFRARGYLARRNDVKREECPHDGLIAKWWLEGWDGVYAEPPQALTADKGEGD